MSGAVDETDTSPVTTVPKHTRKASLKETVLMQKADSVKAMAEAAIAAAAAAAEAEKDVPTVKGMIPHHHKRTSITANSVNPPPAPVPVHDKTQQQQQRRTSMGAAVNAEVLELQNKLMIEEANHHKIVVQVIYSS